MIVEVLFKDFGTGGITQGPCPWVDGRDAILEMKENDFPGWKEVEWAGYHIKYLVQKACQEHLKGAIKPLSQVKRHLVKGEYLGTPDFSQTKLCGSYSAVWMNMKN